MQKVKMFFIVLLGLAIVLVLLGLLIPSTAKVSRAVIINSSKDSVMQRLKDVKGWSKWLPWITLDSSASIKLSGNTSGTGAFIEWKSADSRRGTGRITIKQVLPDGIITMNEIPGLPDNVGGLRIRPAKDTSITQLEWYMLPKMKWYPWERFYGIFVDRYAGPTLQYGLDQLKEDIEQHR